jgi:hypothetical protein
MRHPSILACLVAAELVLCACHESSSAAVAGTVPLTNLRLAAGRVEGDDLLLVVGVPEAAQGGRDRNGDGDARDEVAFAYDVASGAGEDLELGLSPSFPFPLEVRGSTAALVVSEAGQGGLDLNRDGDRSDDVLHVYRLDELGAGTLDNSGLALAPFRPLVSGGFVACALSEAAQGHQDLNGDGDTLDAVLRIVDAQDVVHGPSVAMTTLVGFGWFTTDEAQLGNDLNGDGDALDPDVLQSYDFNSDGVSNTGLDATHVVMRMDILLVVRPSEWLVLLDEHGRGLDLNGDGDADDFVAHRYSEGIATNLGVACVPGPPLLNPVSGHFCVLARETDGVDRNGDGDFEDVTPMVIHEGQLSDAGLALDPASSGIAWAGGQIVFDASEAAQGADLDGDGDMDDLVVHVARGVAGGLDSLNLGLDSQGFTSAGWRAVIPRSELDALTDWNGDGDHQDVVVFVHNVHEDETTNTGVAGLVLGASSERLLLAVPELADGRDWNGDGDRDDLAYVHHDFASGSNASIDGLLGSFPGSGRILASKRSVVLVDEAAQERDLNGDGDRADSVPFVE